MGKPFISYEVEKAIHQEFELEKKRLKNIYSHQLEELRKTYLTKITILNNCIRNLNIENFELSEQLKKYKK